MGNRQNRETGKPEWKFKTEGLADHTPVADAAAAYTAASDGRLYAVGRKDGKKLWHFEADPAPGARPKGIGSPLFARNALHFASYEGQFYAVTTGGELKWKLRPVENSRIYSAPVSDGARFFLTTAPRMQLEGEPAPNPPGEAALIAVGLK